MIPSSGDMVPIGPPQFDNALGLDVSAYGAVDDGNIGYFAATWVNEQASLTIASGTVNINVQNTGPNGVAKVTLQGGSPNTGNPGIYLRQEWIGYSIAITGAGAGGGTFVARVTNFFYDQANGNTATLVLSAPAPTPLTSSTQTYACPCFVPSHVGKGLWISNGNFRNAEGETSGFGNPMGFPPFHSTIATYVSPFSVTLANPIKAASVTAQPGSLIAWGTDNATAIVAAGLAAIALGHRSLFFPGFKNASSTGLFCAFEWTQNYQHGPTALDANQLTITGALIWYGNSRSFVTAATGSVGASVGWFWDNYNRKQIIPWNAGEPTPPETTVFGRAHLPRCNSLSSTLVVCITGDSWGAISPNGMADGNLFEAFVTQFKRQNPTKTVHVVYRAIGGTTWKQLASTANLAAVPGLPWTSGGGSPWSSYLSSVAVDGLGTVTPDLIAIFMTGQNAPQGLHINDIATVINNIKTFPTTNGFAPDVLMISGAVRNSEAWTTGAFEYFSCEYESLVLLQQSFARKNGIGYFDLGTRADLVNNGWAPAKSSRRIVPALLSGAATNLVPYSLQYHCRDFFLALELVGTSGSDFWTRATSVQIQMSPKPDNRLILSVDGSNNLNVQANLWGMTVPTTVTTVATTPAITTSGQSSLNTGTQVSIPAPPHYTLSNANAAFSSGLLGDCFLAPGFEPDGSDLRTYLIGYTNNGIMFGCDGIDSFSSNPTTCYAGGQMFQANDAGAAADFIIPGAGAAGAPWQGKISAYTSKTQATANSNASTSLTAQVENMFLGRISVGPTYDTAVAAGSDGGANPILTISKRGSKIRVGYVLGSNISGNDIRQTLQTYEQTVWEGEIECYGGPYTPLIWIGNTSNTITMQALYMWIDEREYYNPPLTARELWGVSDPLFGGPWGGDDGHPSHRFMSRVVEPVVGTQNLCSS